MRATYSFVFVVGSLVVHHILQHLLADCKERILTLEAALRHAEGSTRGVLERAEAVVTEAEGGEVGLALTSHSTFDERTSP